MEVNTWEGFAALIVGVSAVVVAAGALVRRLRDGARKWDAFDALVAMAPDLRDLLDRVASIEQLLEKELTHNHGSSIKDDVLGMAVGLGKVARRLDTMARLAAAHHPDHAAEYLRED